MRAAAIKNVKMADETEEKGPDYSTEDSFVPPDAGRLRKLNSNLGITHGHPLATCKLRPSLTTLRKTRRGAH